MTQTAIRRQLQKYIAFMPYKNIKLLSPLIKALATDGTDFALETDLTQEEKQIIKAGKKEYKTHPEHFENFFE